MAYEEKHSLHNGRLILYRRGKEGQSKSPSPNWYVKIKLPREPADRFSLGTSDLEEAKSLASDAFLERTYRKKKGLSLKPVRFASVARSYLADLQQRTENWERLPKKDKGNLPWASKNKLRNQRAIITKHLIPYFESHNIQDITNSDIKDYITYRQNYWLSGDGAETKTLTYLRNEKPITRNKRSAELSAPSYGTINKDLTVLRQIFAYGHEQEILSREEIPTISNITKPKEYDSDHERPSFTDEELDIVITSLAKKWQDQTNPKHRRAHFRLLLYVLLLSMTGMRVTEAKNLRFSDFSNYEHGGSREIKILVGGKNKQRLITPLDGFEKLLRHWKLHHKRNAEVFGWTFTDDIYVLTNEYGKRINSHASALDSHLADCGLLYDEFGRKRSAGSFRSQYITNALLNSELTPIQIAVNCGTSVEVIDKHYNRLQSIHMPEKFRFKSVVAEYF